ncbi:MAG: hypothetical protein AAFX04_07895 [Pseudomonadota bacterium]
MASFLIATFFTAALVFAAWAMISTMSQYGDAIRSTLSGYQPAPLLAQTHIRHRSQPVVTTRDYSPSRDADGGNHGQVIYFQFADCPSVGNRKQDIDCIAA